MTVNNSNIQVAEFDIFLSDLNGQLRGKRLPATSLDKIMTEGFKMPRSVVGVDYWGDDVIENGLVFETGDSDGICVPIKNTLAPVTWEDAPRQQVISMMTNPDGSPFTADPRQCLQVICEKFKALGLTPVVATELEFYLFDIASIQAKQPMMSPWMPQGYAFERNDVYSIGELDDFKHILSEIREACDAQGVPADTVIAEMGTGQFELNLNHEADALSAADHAVMFKRIVKGVAKKHGHLASFMAKPAGDKSGNGFHVHFSLLDESGKNIFDSGTAEGTDVLRHAIAGLIECMRASMLIFAPHANSYRRFTPGAHAPIVANWGYENRTVAVRVPESPNVARRIEHRVAGADANPYLVLAAVLGAALHGITNKLEAPEETVGDTYASELPHQSLPTEWPDAIRAFDGSELIKNVLSDQLVEVFTAVKLQEFAKFKARVTDAEYETYLGTL
ncbi:glutamine synthetase family protein [Terasakiella sp. SH-1]|uniref:glutamine synthetase family protein n=1 Tax=Terasakiella sp. SH-1 TaxID=2560057 RepID=UPI001F101481|nr:glutamine synthetase family protein [Terasakiella sp. SH-1]